MRSLAPLPRHHIIQSSASLPVSPAPAHLCVRVSPTLVFLVATLCREEQGQRKVALDTYHSRLVSPVDPSILSEQVSRDRESACLLLLSCACAAAALLCRRLDNAAFWALCFPQRQRW